MLRRVLDKGDRILRLAEICRKLETEEEKVLPFYSNTLSEDQNEDVEVRIQMVRASASGVVDSGLIPSRVKPMTLKLIFSFLA